MTENTTVEINYSSGTKMLRGFPEFHRLGIVSPNGESSPFLWKGRLMRLELSDPSRGTDAQAVTKAIIRERETGRIVSAFGEGCYYYSLYTEGEKVFVLGTKSLPGILAGESVVLYESEDLVSWSERELLSNPGWKYYNTALTKGPEGYVLLLEASEPREFVGEKPFTFFFATSPDMVNWTFTDYSLGFSPDRYMGGPWMRWSGGYYYVISVTELPCARYSNYIYRTKDLVTWEVGYYNPILSPCEEDRKLAPHGADITPEMEAEIKTGFLSSSSDMDMCDSPWGGTLFTYNVGNQLGFYYMCEATSPLGVDEFLAANFE
ncbi:MAG: hypothetical protein IJY86_10940 [Clostridia bacterium]|nr:hypothetical protein [Clostridia bacterium]